MMFVLVVILVVFKNTLWLAIAISVQDVVSLWVGANEGSVFNSLGEEYKREKCEKYA